MSTKETNPEPPTFDDALAAIEVRELVDLIDESRYYQAVHGEVQRASSITWSARRSRRRSAAFWVAAVAASIAVLFLTGTIRVKTGAGIGQAKQGEAVRTVSVNHLEGIECGRTALDQACLEFLELAPRLKMGDAVDVNQRNTATRLRVVTALHTSESTMVRLVSEKPPRISLDIRVCKSISTACPSTEISVASLR